jgi:hypothetical protein
MLVLAQLYDDCEFGNFARLFALLLFGAHVHTVASTIFPSQTSRDWDRSEKFSRKLHKFVRSLLSLTLKGLTAIYGLFFL